MNKVAHYNGFVGRCQQYGLTKQAADMLYKQAGGFDRIKDYLAKVKGSLEATWDTLSPAAKKMIIGGGSGLLTGGVAGALVNPKQRLRNAILGALLGTTVGTGIGYGANKAMALWDAPAASK